MTTQETKTIKTASPTTDATAVYRAAIVEECRSTARAQNAKTTERLIKKFSGGTLSLKLSPEGFAAAGSPSITSHRVEGVTRNKGGVSVRVSPVVLFAAVAAVRGAQGIDARAAYVGILADLNGDAGALAAFNAVTAKSAERTPSPVFAALKA